VLHFHAQRVGARGGVKPIAKRWNGPGNLISYRERCLRGDDKYSAEKPLDLMLTIVSAFSDPGEIVLDLCAGVGTTILAARLLGRQGVGYEIDPRAAARAAEREEEPLSNRDRARAVEWCAGVEAEAVLIPDPRSLRRNPRHSDEQHAAKQRSMTATWERAQRRLEDKERVRQWL
jgi:SAM-dependent methyltransferase